MYEILRILNGEADSLVQGNRSLVTNREIDLADQDSLVCIVGSVQNRYSVNVDIDMRWNSCRNVSFDDGIGIDIMSMVSIISEVMEQR